MSKGILYLIPVSMGNNNAAKIVPTYNLEIISSLKHFIVENGKTARTFIKDVIPGVVLQELNYYELNQHTKEMDVHSLINPLLKGENIGLMSEAGCPAVADPGAEVVRLAHRHAIKVVPLVGPSSILMSIMASGLSGQNFAFNGYLPKEKNDRTRRIKEFEKTATTRAQSQFFIETPYRNDQMIAELLATLSPVTNLLIACDITCDTEYIKMKPVAEWKKNALPSFSKRPCMFGIGA